MNFIILNEYKPPENLNGNSYLTKKPADMFSFCFLKYSVF